MVNTEVKSMEVKEKLRDFIVTNFLFGDGGVEFGENDSFLEKGIIDSTGILELIEYLEETWSISIEDDELIPENLDSVSRVAAFIARKTETANG